MEILYLHKYSDPLLSTLLKHLWQRLQHRVFLGIWGVSPILLCRSSQALSGWRGRVPAQLFSGLSRDVRLGSSPGSGWATQGHWDLSQSHSCVVLAACLGSLSCWMVKLRTNLRSWALWSRFSWRISLYFAPFIFSLILTSLPLKNIPTVWYCHQHASP